jgi:hypothetical protein
LFQQHAGDVFAQREFDLRILLAIFADDGWDERVERGGAGKSDADGAALAARDRLGGDLGAVDLVENGFRSCGLLGFRLGLICESRLPFGRTFWVFWTVWF